MTDATPTEPPHEELPRGLCPRCEGGRLLSFFCDYCDSRGAITYPPVWTPAEDETLRRLISEGRSITIAGITLRRPPGVVRTRLSVLGLEYPGDRALEPTIALHDVDGATIPLDDAARRGGWR